MNLVEFPNREQASRDASHFLAEALRQKLTETGAASLLVSGGSSPVDCLNDLSQEKLTWNNVYVSLTDERCVPEDHAESNTAMVKKTLLVGLASEGNFVHPEEAHQKFLENSCCACLLGMGTDGHFASIFPDAENLLELLDPHGKPGTQRVTTGASPYQRITMNLALLTEADALLLLVFGEEKRRVIAKPDGRPISALINQQKRPLTVYWAP